nr:MAG TPA: hypothetical protein [Caudoviricetes sp.]
MYYNTFQLLVLFFHSLLSTLQVNYLQYNAIQHVMHSIINNYILVYY